MFEKVQSAFSLGCLDSVEKKNIMLRAGLDWLDKSAREIWS